MKFATILLVLAGLVIPIAAHCQEAWILKKEKNGIKVFSRKTETSKYDELKVECVFEGRLSQLAAVLLDVNKHREWVYKTTKSELLKRNTASDLYFYTEIESPWPFENRDLVCRLNIVQNPANKVLTVVASNVNGYLPEKDKITRIKYSRATWTITPISNKQFKIDYILQIDLGDGVPAWLLNLFSVNGPYESFSKLKEKIKSPQYAQARLPFIED